MGLWIFGDCAEAKLVSKMSLETRRDLMITSMVLVSGYAALGYGYARTVQQTGLILDVAQAGLIPHRTFTIRSL